LNYLQKKLTSYRTNHIKYQFMSHNDEWNDNNNSIEEETIAEEKISGKLLCQSYLEIYKHNCDFFSDQASALSIRDEQRDALLRWMTAICITCHLTESNKKIAVSRASNVR